MNRVLLVLALALGALAGAAPAARGGDSGLTDEDRADLAWLSGLGYPSVRGKPLVVAVQDGEKNVMGWEVRGFVLDESATEVHMLSLGLGDYRIARSPPGTPVERSTRFERLDAEHECGVWLAGGPTPTGRSWEWWRAECEPSVATQILVLASALAQAPRGEHDRLVHALLAHARTLRPEIGHHGPRDDDPAKPLRERAAADLAATETQRAKLSLIGYRAPHERPAQLEAFRAILRRFPASADEAEVRELAETLERMIREADERAKTAKPPEQMSADERIADLVFRLRDQTGGASAMGGPGMITDGPYKDLVALGRLAVPALLEALVDESLTRRGGVGRGGGHPYVQRVGDLAFEAIEEIAGRSFPVPADTTLPKSDRKAYRTAVRDAARPAVTAWLAAADAGREADDFVRAVEAGDWYASRAARTLLARDPQRLPGAVARGIEAATDLRCRGELIELLAKHPGDVGRDVLRQQATEGHPWVRLPAALGLAEMGDPAAADALHALWRERRDGGGPAVWTPSRSAGRDREDELRSIVRALVAMRRADAVKALDTSTRPKSPAARRALAAEFATAREDAADDFAEALEDGLVAGLGDRTEYADEHGAHIPVEGWALRVCDVAAAALAPLHGVAAPRKSDPLWRRDAMVREVMRAYPFTAGHPRFEPHVDPVPLERCQAAIDAVAAHAFGTPEREAALRDVEALGLGALPALREALAAKRFGYAVDVETVAGRMAFRVSEMHCLFGKELPQAIRAQVQSLQRGEQLTAAALRDLVAATVANVPGALSGASLDVYRGPGEDGVVISLTWLDGTGDGWETSALAAVGGRYVGGAFGSWSAEAPGEDPELAEMCERALAAPPGVWSWVHVRVVRKSPE